MSSESAKPVVWQSSSAESELGLHSGRFSPDGRFIAYVANESGRHEIYISDLDLDSEARPRQKVSQAGGWEPAWSPDGRELFYRNVDGSALMVVTIETERMVTIGEPEKLLDTPEMPPPLWYGSYLYDVAPDGRFLMVHETEERDAPMNLVVVLNWLEELERLVPAND